MLIVGLGDRLGIGVGVGAVGLAAEVDRAADHADAGPIAQDIFGVFGSTPQTTPMPPQLNSAKVSPTEPSTHSSGRWYSGFHLVMVRPRAPMEPPIIHLAVGHGVADAVGGIALDGDLGADIEIADIVRGGAVADDGGAGHGPCSPGAGRRGR